MTFIRAKEIPPRSGNWYDYEVMTIHEGKKVIQKHIRYIGKSNLRPSRSMRSGGVTAAYPVVKQQAPTTPIMNTATIHKMKTPAAQIASAMGLYYGGMSLDAIQQQFRQEHDLLDNPRVKATRRIHVPSQHLVYANKTKRITPKTPRLRR